jgi:ABC-type nickel/cobalt efflux system permease component RcnA
MSSDKDLSQNTEHHHHHHHHHSSEKKKKSSSSADGLGRRYLPSVKKRKQIEKVLFTVLTIVAILIFAILGYVMYFDVR